MSAEEKNNRLINRLIQPLTMVHSPMLREGVGWVVYSDSSALLRSGDDGNERVITVDGKRLFDLVIGSILLLIFLPIMIVVAMAIWISSLGRYPVLYRQQRVGFNGELFTLVKFRSMPVDAEKDGVRSTAVSDPRVTRIGKLIRVSRMDELPQLFQVLKGDMSLVGPRPERPEFVRDYNDAISGYQYRHMVKPGLTGWAQVNCGYGDSVEDAARKLFYDLNYIQHNSLSFDLSVLLKTIPVVLFGCGAR